MCQDGRACRDQDRVGGERGRLSPGSAGEMVAESWKPGPGERPDSEAQGGRQVASRLVWPMHRFVYLPRGSAKPEVTASVLTSRNFT